MYLLLRFIGVRYSLEQDKGHLFLSRTRKGRFYRKSQRKLSHSYNMIKEKKDVFPLKSVLQKFLMK